MAKPEGEAGGAEGRRVFLSHSSRDTAEVEALRAALDGRGIACFLDALDLKAGDGLSATLKDRVQEARAFVVVLSPAAVSSTWVRQEIEWALAAEDLATETRGRFRFLPVFPGGITHGFLDWLGRPEVLGIDANGRALADVASEIAQALGVLPVDARPRPAAAPLAPIAELTLDFHDLSFESVAADPDPALVPMLAALGAVGETHVLVTGREPAPAGLGAVELGLGALGKREGRTLVEQVLRRGAQGPKEERGDPADGSWGLTSWWSRWRATPARWCCWHRWSQGSVPG